MDTLFGWKAKRAGGKITVEHSCGKVAGVDYIEPRHSEEDGWHIVAVIEGSNLEPRRELLLGIGSAV